MNKINDTTYNVRHGIYDTEIGDIKNNLFQPQIKIKLWENKANFSMRLITLDAGSHDCSHGCVDWDGSNIRCSFINGDGSFDFVTVLKSKPASNSIHYSLLYKSLVFYKQDKLTKADIKGGAVRPDNIVNSYAVYHETKYDDAYKTGKAFHIYRQKATDSTGKWTWCNQDIKNDVLTKTIPRKFLDNACYPVSIK